MKRLPKGTAHDIEVLERYRDATIPQLAHAVARLRRAQTIADKYFARLFRMQNQIDDLRKSASAVAARIASGKGK